MFKAYLINGKNVLASKYILVTIIPSLANREKRQRILRNNRVTNSSIALKSNQSNVTQSKRFFVYILWFNCQFLAERIEHDFNQPQHYLKDEKDCYESNKFPFYVDYSVIRGGEKAENSDAKSLSEKIIRFFSEKMNTVSPEVMEEYRTVAVLKAGGIFSSDEEHILKEQNDIEQVVTNE